MSIGVRDSICGLLNRWNGTEVTNANTVENSADVADGMIASSKTIILVKL